MTKIPNFENSRWRTAAILKMVLSQYLSRQFEFNEIWCADANFDSKNSHVTNYRNFANSKWLTAAIFKIVISDISTIYCSINAKFCTKKQNHTQTQVTLPKYQTEFLFVSDWLYVGLHIWWVLWVNRRCLPMLIVLQGYKSAICTQ